MTRFIMLLSFVALSFLLIGSLIAPNSPTMWLASSLGGYQILRVVLIGFLFALLVSDPPRYVWFRVLTGILATTLTVWTLSSTYQNQMQFLDSTSILMASIAMALEALEFRPEPSNEIPLRHAKKLKTKAA